MHLFAYGTLMFPEIWRRVVGWGFETQRGTLQGYAAYRVAGDVFPVLLRGSADDQTPGVVYFDLHQAALDRLDEHESDLYERVALEVVLEDGRQVACQAYVLRERNRELASRKRWTADWFQRAAMTEYIGRRWPS